MLKCALRLSQSEYSGQTTEAAEVGATIIQVVASGSQGVTYSILAPSPISDLFRITSTGEIKVKSNLRTGTNTRYEFDIQASTSECSVRARVNILVVRNINPPVITPGMLKIADYDHTLCILICF